jgi:hypothetical protein
MNRHRGLRDDARQRPTLRAVTAHPGIAAEIELPPARGSGAWIDRLLAWLDGLPGPVWATYAALAVAGLIISNAIPWLDGQPVGLDLYWSVFGLFPVLELLLIRHLDRVAEEALMAFRPLVPRDEAGFQALLRKLTRLRPAEALIVTALWLIGGMSATLSDLDAHRILGVTAPAAALIFALEIAINALLSVFVLKAVHRFFDVSRIHEEAPRIDLFNQGPLYGFARLTSQTALSLLLLLAVLVPSLAPRYVAGATELTRLNFVSMVAMFGLGAVAIFVVPLYGIHRRIAAEKERLQAASGARVTAVLADLDHDVRAGELGRADGLNKQLASVLAERDVLARLPTWPVQAATLRSFVSALVLPVLVYVLARAAERIVL